MRFPSDRIERTYNRLGDGFNIEMEALSLAELLICNQRVTMHFTTSCAAGPRPKARRSSSCSWRWP